MLQTECLCSPENSYVEALTSNVMTFGDGGLWEVMKVRRDNKGSAL